MPTKTRRGKRTSAAGSKTDNFDFDERWTNFAVIVSYILLTAVTLANIQMNSFYQGMMLLAVIVMFIGVALRFTRRV